jgi:transcription termination/antitermination protein NusG
MSYWYLIQTELKSELEVSRYIAGTLREINLKAEGLLPSPRIARARRHMTRPYLGIVFIQIDLTQTLLEKIEQHPKVYGFVREIENYLIEFEGSQIEDGGGSVQFAIQKINSLGIHATASSGRAPFITSEAKLYQPAPKALEALTSYFKEHEGCDFPVQSDFIEVKMYFNQRNRALLREVPGIIDFVGGEQPLAKKNYAIQPAELSPLKIRASVVERFAKHQYQYFVIQTHSQFEGHVIKSLNHHRSLDEESLFKGEQSDLFINSAQFVANETDANGEVKKKFTGYIYVSMHMSIDSWHHVKSISKVAGFVGGKNIEEVRPVSINDGYETHSKRTQELKNAASIELEAAFEVGDVIDIIDGPFATYMGEVQEVAAKQERLRVLIDPSRSLLAQRDSKDRSRFSTDLNFSAEVEFKQVKKLD